MAEVMGTATVVGTDTAKRRKRSMVTVTVKVTVTVAKASPNIVTASASIASDVVAPFSRPD